MLPIRYLTLIVASVAVGAASIVMPRAAHAGGTCHDGSGVTDSRGTMVAMTNNCFVSTILRVDEGDTVTFHNKDEAPHTVTGVAWTWGDDKEIAGGEQVQHVFDENGVYVYTCILHPGMAGAVVVGDGSGLGLATALVHDEPRAALGIGSPANVPNDAADTSETASAAASDEDSNSMAIAGALAGGAVLLVGIAGGSTAIARASSTRRAAGR
jgi:plastocyanin